MKTYIHIEFISLLIYYAQIMRHSGRECEGTSEFTFLTAVVVGFIVHACGMIHACTHMYRVIAQMHTVKSQFNDSMP